MPTTKPMMMAPLQSTKPAAGVMATRPATAPLITLISVGLPFTNHSVNIQDMPAAPVATWVVTMAMPAWLLAAPAEPALKPNQPTLRRWRVSGQCEGARSALHTANCQRASEAAEAAWRLHVWPACGCGGAP